MVKSTLIELTPKERAIKLNFRKDRTKLDCILSPKSNWEDV